jgi:hypothetical protein
MSFPVRTLLFALTAVIVFPLVADAQRVRKDPNRITEEELRAASATNAFDLIRSTRPAWLRTRGVTSLRGEMLGNPQAGTAAVAVPAEPAIIVYVDGTRFGTQRELRLLPLEELVLLEFLDHSRATNRFGVGHTYGAIVATRKR